jgi:glucose/arabinose dehydrogenase
VIKRSLAAAICCTSMLLGCGDDAPSVPGPSPSATFATQPTIAPTSAAAPSTGTVAPEPTLDTAEPSTSSPPATPPTQPLGDPVVALQSLGQFREPVDLAWRAADPTAYIVERDGTVIALRADATQATTLDMSELTEGQGEQGLLGLTFSADGALAYVNHTDNAGDTVIAEYAVDNDGLFDPASRRVLLTIEQPYSNHNGGNVTIGPDGMLYIGMGDGGSGGDPERYSLNVSSLLGKILRIDPAPTAAAPYGIPVDNPFVDVAGARGEIWSVGVRNPWRMSFDSVTGDLWIADVGQNEVEEVSVGWANDDGLAAGRGLNFGWSAFEGTRRFNDDQPADGATPPIYEYDRANGGCSISGGAVYRGNAIPALVGWYVFGDYCNGQLIGLKIVDRAVTDSILLGSQPANAAVRVGPDGELYAISLDGDISRIVAG